MKDQTEHPALTPVNVQSWSTVECQFIQPERTGGVPACAKISVQSCISGLHPLPASSRAKALRHVNTTAPAPHPCGGKKLGSRQPQALPRPPSSSTFCSLLGDPWRKGTFALLSVQSQHSLGLGKQNDSWGFAIAPSKPWDDVRSKLPDSVVG